MHESSWNKEALKWMKKRWEKDYFISESFIPYGCDNIFKKSGRPDILRINNEGKISIVELKKFRSEALKKWQVLGEFMFYNFLIETQLFHDKEDYFWLTNLFKKGVSSMKIIDRIKSNHTNGSKIVQDWVLVICGGDREELQNNETIWFMHDYINSLDIQPFIMLHCSDDQGIYELNNLRNKIIN